MRRQEDQAAELIILENPFEMLVLRSKKPPEPTRSAAVTRGDERATSDEP